MGSRLSWRLDDPSDLAWEGLTRRRGVSATGDPGTRIFCAEPAVCPCDGNGPPVYRSCPISHVPVAACRLVGIRPTAGQPPGVLKDRWLRGWIPSGRHPGGNTGPRQQPAAGGETGEPRSPRGTQLKATTNGLFWSRRPSKGRHRRGLFLFARRAVGNPYQSTAASGCSRARDRRVSPKHATRRDAAPPDAGRLRAVQISTTRPA